MNFRIYRTTDKYCSWDCGKLDSKAKAKTKTTKKKNGDRAYTKNRKEKVQENLSSYGKLTCESCFESALKPPMFKEECHHIVYRSEKPNHKEIHNKDNLIILCSECHDWIHRSKKRRNKIVEERKLFKLFGEDVRNK